VKLRSIDPPTTAPALAVRLVAGTAFGYVVGMFPSADLAARVVADGDIDLRATGTGNPGAANAHLVLGPKAGAGVLFADMAKAVVAGTVGRRLGAMPGANAASAAAVLGHCYPIWNNFRGGKGVAASVGQVGVTFPSFLPIDAAVTGLTAKLWPGHKASFAAVVAGSAGWLTAATVWWRRGWPTGSGSPAGIELPIAAAVSSAAILQRFWSASRNEAAR